MPQRRGWNPRNQCSLSIVLVLTLRKGLESGRLDIVFTEPTLLKQYNPSEPSVVQIPEVYRRNAAFIIPEGYEWDGNEVPLDR